jgi:hypothetical protein
MLKKITSIEEIKIGDLLIHGPNPEQTKEYQIKNIGNGYAYAVHQAGETDLKIITAHSLMENNWWRRELT